MPFPTSRLVDRYPDGGPTQSVRLMWLFARLAPDRRAELLAVAEMIAHDSIWPDTTAPGALETGFTDFDPEV